MNKFLKVIFKEEKKEEVELSLKSVNTTPDNLILSKNYDVLVLSGGAEKGITQLGVLHNLYEKRFIFFSDLCGFVGTSIGSVICFLLILGLLPIEILSFVCIKNFDFNVNLLNIIYKFGVCSSDPFFEIVEKITIDKLGFIPTLLELFELFGKYFVCVTHNLSDSENDTVYIDHLSNPNLSCIEALKMSCNIPLIFEKYVYDNNVYIDGALSDNYPIEYAHKLFLDKKILGIAVDTVSYPIKGDDTNIINYIKNIFAVSYRNNYMKSKKYSAKNIHSIVVTVYQKNINLLALDKDVKFKLFSLGYQAVKEIVKSKKDNFVLQTKKVKID